MRDDEPMPPFNPKQVMPVPAPTSPSSNVSPAAAIASSPCCGVTAIARIVLIGPSLHSMTTGLTVPVSTPISACRSSAWRTSAS